LNPKVVVATASPEAKIVASAIENPKVAVPSPPREAVSSGTFVAMPNVAGAPPAATVTVKAPVASAVKPKVVVAFLSGEVVSVGNIAGVFVAMPMS